MNDEVIRKPRVVKMPWRVSDGLLAPVVTRRIDMPRSEQESAENLNVILAVNHPDVVAASNAVTGSRGICGCGDPTTKVQHPAVNGGQPTWIHDHSPEVAHPVRNVRCITRP